MLSAEDKNKNIHISHLLEKIQINCQNLIMSLPHRGSDLYIELMKDESHEWKFDQMIHSTIWLSDVAARKQMKIRTKKK